MTNAIQDSCTSTGLSVGDEYTAEELQQLELEGTAQLEQLLRKTFAARINGEYVTFTVESLTCTEITDTDSISIDND